MKTKLFFISLLFSTISFAQNIFQDNMNSYTVGTQLSGQGSWTNNSSNGGLGSCSGAICANAKVLGEGVSYAGYGSSLQCLELLSDRDGCGTLFPAVSTGDLYVAFVANIFSTTTSPNDFFRVMSGSAFNTSFRLYVKDAGGGTFSFGFSKGGNATIYGSAIYNYNENHLIVFKYSQVAGTNNDVLSLYVDPVYANGLPASSTITTSAGADQAGNIDRLAFRQGTSNTPSGNAGLVSVARTWQDLTFLPLAVNQFENNTIVISGENAQNGILSIQSTYAIAKSFLRIYNLNGALLENKTIALSTSISEVNITPLRSVGTYIVQITDEAGKRITQKILVK